MPANVITRFGSQGAKEVQQDAKNVKRGIDDVGKSGKRAASDMEKLGTAMGVVGAGFAAAVGAGKVAIDMALLGDRVDGATSALNALTGGQADRYLRAVSEATNNTVTELEALTIANGFVSLGLANTAEEAAEFARISSVLGQTIRGIPAAEAAEEFQLMLSNMSIARLDTFGISASNVRTRIIELQAATPGLTREQAFLTAVMEEGTAKADLLEGSVQGLNSEWQQFNATMGDASAALGEVFNQRMTPMIAGFNDLTEASSEFIRTTQEQTVAIAANSSGVREYRQGIRALRRDMTIWERNIANTVGLLDTSQASWERNTAAAQINTFAMSQAGNAGLELNQMWRDNTMATEEATVSNDELLASLEAAQLSLIEYNSAVQMQAGLQMQAQESAAAIRGEYGSLASIYDQSAGLIGGLNMSQQEQLRTLNDLALATGQMTQLDIDRGTAQRRLINLLAESAITADDYVAALQAIGQGAEPIETVDNLIEDSTANMFNLSDGAADSGQSINELRTIAEGVPEPLDNIIARLDDIEGERTTTLLADGSNVHAVLDGIANRIADIQAMPIPGSAGSSGSIPGNALGGMVEAGQASIVGESGRELFIPETDGFIVPNFQTEDMTSGNMTQTTYNLGGIVIPPAPPQMQQNMSQAQYQRLIEEAINEALQKAQRSASSAVGGLSI